MLPLPLKSIASNKALDLLLAKYDSGIPNTFVVGDFNLDEWQVWDAITSWRIANPKCRYNPMITNGKENMTLLFVLKKPVYIKRTLGRTGTSVPVTVVIILVLPEHPCGSP